MPGMQGAAIPVYSSEINGTHLRPLRAFDVALHYFNRNPDGYPEGKRAINCRLR
jgi:hypothetical protein